MLRNLLINALVLEAFQEVIPGVTGNLVYFISHNIARKEVIDGRECWEHRKGATRAFPAGKELMIRGNQNLRDRSMYTKCVPISGMPTL